MENVTTETSPTETEDKILKTSLEYTREAEDARLKRLDQNRVNWDVYHLNQDYGHKRPGQSKEFLAKQAMAVEQTTEFFQQGLVDIDDWWRVDYQDGVQEQQLPITKEEVKKITDFYFDKLNGGEGLVPFIGDSVKSALLGSLAIAKVYGNVKKKSFYTFENRVKSQDNSLLSSVARLLKPKVEPVLKRGFNEIWELEMDLLEPFEYGVDPSPAKLFEYQEIYIDYFEAKKLASGPDAIYDMKILNSIKSEMSEQWSQRVEKARQTNQPIPNQNRKKLRIQEFWGTIVDMVSGEILFENVVWTIANGRHLLQKPVPNPFWHGESPFVVAPLIRVPKSRWHKALMDAPTRHNLALNEIYNLMLDGGMMQAYGVTQYRPDYMEDESSAAEGFVPGQSVAVSSDCPPGMKVIEPVVTGSAPEMALQMFQLTNAEFSSSALTNDMRMGVIPNKQVKATEVVESSNTINSVHTGISKVFEVNYLEKLIEKSWKVILQNADNLDIEPLKAILGDQRALQIAALSPQERYAKCVDKNVFRVFGVSKTIAKVKDFKKITALLQTISASPLLMQEFGSQFSMQKLLGDIMTSLDVNTEKLKMSDQEKMEAQQRMQQAMAQQMQLKQGGNTNQQNIPQAATGSSHMTTEGQLPHAGGHA